MVRVALRATLHDHEPGSRPGRIDGAGMALGFFHARWVCPQDKVSRAEARQHQAFSNSQLWKDASMDNHQLTETGTKIASHLLAVIAGLILVLIGLLLSVPMVGLPLGIPIGLAGVLICLWGLFGTTTQKPVTPPHV